MLAVITPLSIGVAVATESFLPSGFATVIKKVVLADWITGLESVTFSPKLNVPRVVGVPLTCPPLGSIELSPGGKDPDVKANL